MNFRSHWKEDPEINLIPLIDVLLVILIFLMVTTTYSKYAELQINLPSAAADKQADRPNEINVTISAAGELTIDRRPVQLTVPQFELVALLYQRARDGSSGYVQVSELVRTLSLESTEPTEDHVRQLVRRLRRVLAKADLPDLIESRYGLGYRLALLRA